MWLHKTMFVCIRLPCTFYCTSVSSVGLRHPLHFLLYCVTPPHTSQATVTPQLVLLCTKTPTGAWPFLSVTLVSIQSRPFAYDVFPSHFLWSTPPLSLFSLLIWNRAAYQKLNVGIE